MIALDVSFVLCRVSHEPGCRIYSEGSIQRPRCAWTIIASIEGVTFHAPDWVHETYRARQSGYGLALNASGPGLQGVAQIAGRRLETGKTPTLLVLDVFDCRHHARRHVVKVMAMQRPFAGVVSVELNRNHSH